tara:strand:+ start:3617 stop:6802 length:3186 start_codon:yes stop_codon:yes gene_type:complete
VGEGRSAFIVDNRETDITDKVQGYLEKWCEVSRQFDIATGYFEVGALSRLDGEWQKLDKIRILMGREVSRTTKDALVTAITEQLDNSFDEEKEKHGNEFLRGIPAIIEGIRSGKIECRVYTPHKFHAKMYITHAKHDIMGPVALVGSSNFTVPGISRNIELNVRIETGHQVVELQEWFEHFWEHDGTEPINEEILEVMETHAHEYEPFLLYGKSLEEYFRDKETVGPAVWHEQHSLMWPILDKYQQDGYQSMIEISRKWGGSFLCDGVGLGKTYVGLMLIERLAVHERKNVLLLTPKSAYEGVWEPELKDKLSELGGWGSNFKHLKHTDLTRQGYHEHWQAAKDKFDCIIVDEAHHFRNREKSKRFKQFMEFINEGNEKQIFFLTATPINNSILDLKHMIDLFTGDNDKHFNKPPLSIPSLYGHFRRLRNALSVVVATDGIEDIDLSAQLAKEKANQILREDKLVRELIIQRSRRYVKESQKISSGRDIQFPEPQPPQIWNYNLREIYGDLLDDFEQAFDKEDPLFKLSIYYPYEYYRDQDALEEMEDFDFKVGRCKQIARLIRIGILKRFESSVHAFETSCCNLMLKLVAWLDAHQIDADAKTRLNKWKEENENLVRHAKKIKMAGFEDDDEVDEEEEEEEDAFTDLPNVEKNIWSNDLFEVQKIIDDTYNDLAQVITFIEKLKPITPKDDTKLDAIVELVNTDAASETGKVIIFTEYMTTARYLKKHLVERLPECSVAEVDSQTKTKRTTIIRRFSPYYNGSSSAKLIDDGEKEIDILISTDVLAEGLNLQDSTRLVNYDIHWNPVRLMQRIGRIDRRMNPDHEAAIIAAHPERSDERGKIGYWNFLPPDNLDNLINLYGKVTGKYILISKVLGIQHGHGLDSTQDMDELKEFNEEYDGFETTDESLRLILDRLIADHPEQAKKWRKMPFHTLSGKANEEGRKGVFFCYRIPEPVSLSDEEIERGVVPGWSTEDGMGESLWFFYDTEAEEILDQIGQMSEMHKIIECSTETERVISLDDETLRNIKKKVEKRIKNTIMRTLQAPVKGAKPRLVCWLNIS